LPFFIILVSAGEISGQWLEGYSHRKEITIDAGQVSGSLDLIDFPMLLKRIDADLKSVYHGGLVTNDDGWDILFTDDDGFTLMDHEIELYTDSIGELVAWVRIPVLSPTEDTEIYMYFGNPSVSSDPSTPNTWSNSYRGVWHLTDNTEDASQSSNDGMDNGTASATGKIGKARSFDGTDDYIRMETNDLYDNLSQGTVIAWAKWEGSDFETIFGADSGPCEHPFEFAIESGDFAIWADESGCGGSFQANAPITSPDDWHQVAYVVDGIGNSLYIDGEKQTPDYDAGSENTTHFLNASSTGTTIYEIGRSVSYNPEVFDGLIDEVRVASAPLSEDWIKTSYANEHTPALFIAVEALETLNDLPCDARSFNVSEECSDSIFNNSGSTDSGISLTACAGYSGSDLWFKLEVPPSGDLVVSLNTDPIPESPDTSDWLTRAGLAVYSGTCDSLSHDTCWIDESIEGPFADPGINLTGYAPGDTLYVRVWGWNSQTGNFRICGRELDLSIFNVSGSGSYCADSDGLDVIMDGSRSDRTYFLIKNGSVSGPSVDGTGSPIVWPDQTEGVYRVVSTGGPLPNPFMNGKVIIKETPLPVLSAGYQHYKTITIESDSVSGAGMLTNFPVYVSISNDSSLRSVLNGGNVQNANGYDIAFTDVSFEPVPFEIVRYDSSLGSYEAWVSVPELSGTTDTEIQMLYGNPGISLDPSSHETWGTEYLQVLHLDDHFLDASNNGNIGLNYKTNDTVGKLNSARYFDGTDNVITVYDDSTLDGSNDLATLSLWINFDNPVDGDHQLVMSSANRYSEGDGFEWASQGNGNHFFYPRGDVHDNHNMTLNPFSGGLWHYLAVTLDYATKEVIIYVDGAPQPLIFEGVPTFWTGLAEIDNWYWGGNPDRATRYFAGSMDEIRVQDVARTEDWLRTEFSNQAFPSAFLTLSSEYLFDPPADVCEDLPAFPLDLVYPVGGTYSGSGVSEGLFDPALAGSGDHIIRYDYTDASGCSSSAAKVRTVLATPAPLISGKDSVCLNTTGEIYSTSYVANHSYDWVVTGEGASIAEGQGSHEIVVDWGTGSGTVSLTETDTVAGCDSTTTEFLVNVEAMGEPVIICPGDRTEYLDDQCEFTIPDYTILASVDSNCGPDPVIIQSPIPGTTISGSGTLQEIVLLAQFEGEHESECGFNILLQDTISPGITSLNDTTVMVEKGIYKTLVTMPLPEFIDNCGVQTISNDFNGGPDASGEYSFGTTTVVYTVTDVNDNINDFTQRVIIRSENEPEWGLIIPEGFSPNEDGLNDRFEILGLEQYPDNELRVFNVNGNEVYRMAGYDNTWDGISASNLNKGGRLPTGTYYYALYLGVENAIIKGFVYLRRE